MQTSFIHRPFVYLTALLLGAAPAILSSAQAAAVVYENSADLLSGGTLELDLATGTTSTNNSYYGKPVFRSWEGGQVYFQGNGFFSQSQSEIIANFSNGNYFALKLNQGDLIDSSSDYNTSATIYIDPNYLTGSFWNVGDSGYLGLNYTDSSDNTYYGWANVEVTAFNTMTVNSFGYNDTPGASITAGEGLTTSVPEPGSVAMSALIALTFVGFCRQRK